MLAFSVPCSSRMLAWNYQVFRLDKPSQDFKSSCRLVQFFIQTCFVHINASPFVATPGSSVMASWDQPSNSRFLRSTDSSINLQTARETPVIHSVNPRLPAPLIAAIAAAELTELVIQVSIGRAPLRLSTAPLPLVRHTNVSRLQIRWELNALDSNRSPPPPGMSFAQDIPHNYKIGWLYFPKASWGTSHRRAIRWNDNMCYFNSNLLLVSIHRYFTMCPIYLRHW